MQNNIALLHDTYLYTCVEVAHKQIQFKETNKMQLTPTCLDFHQSNSIFYISGFVLIDTFDFSDTNPNAFISIPWDPYVHTVDHCILVNIYYYFGYILIIHETDRSRFFC